MEKVLIVNCLNVVFYLIVPDKSILVLSNDDGHPSYLAFKFLLLDNHNWTKMS